jgi:hypothetical protein
MLSPNSFIDAWANSGYERGPFKAEQLLRRMDDLHHLGINGMQPGAHIFSSVMKAWAEQSSNESAVSCVEQLLISEMEQRYLKPNTLTCMN